MRQEEVGEFQVEGSDEPEPLEILLTPTGLDFNNASKGLGAKGVREVVERKCYPAPVGVSIAPVAATLAFKKKRILPESPDDFASCE